MNKGQLREVLTPLLDIPTAPFHEDDIVEYVTDTLANKGLHLTTDSYGNLIVRRPSSARTAARLGFMAHMDHPGFEVTGNTNQGVRAAWHGGVKKEYFVEARVRFFARGRVYPGVITNWETNEQTGRVATVDVSCAVRPPVGSLGMWDVPRVEFVNGAIRAPAIDDVAGVGVLVAMLLDLADRPIETEIWALFTRAEEVGFVGAIGMARSGRLPLSMPVISVEMSRGVPGGSQGLGPVIRLGDRSSVFDNSVLLFMKDVAADLRSRVEGFKYQEMLMEGGSCEATALNALGFKTGGIAVPLGNYHNQKPAGPSGPWVLDAEEINFTDLANAVELSVALCETFQGLDIVKTHHRLNLLQRTDQRLRRLEYEQRLRERR